MLQKGIVIAVNSSDIKGVMKNPIAQGYFIEDFGLKGDAHAGTGNRQVSLLAMESIRKMMEKGLKELDAGQFAENLTTEGILLHQLPIGTQLRIGQTIQQVTQIGKTCHTGCAIKQQVGECIMPREGIFTKVIVGGYVSAGDTIEIINETLS